MCLIINDEATKKFFAEHPDPEEWITVKKVVRAGNRAVCSSFHLETWWPGRREARGIPKPVESAVIDGRMLYVDGVFHADLEGNDIRGIRECLRDRSKPLLEVDLKVQVKHIKAIGHWDSVDRPATGVVFTECVLEEEEHKRAMEYFFPEEE